MNQIIDTKNSGHSYTTEVLNMCSNILLTAIMPNKILIDKMASVL